jgi:D-aminopeptidase
MLKEGKRSNHNRTPRAAWPHLGVFAVAAAMALAAQGQSPERARDWGIPFTGNPGPLNAITDVPGVTVGMVTLISGDGPLVKGKGPIRTGVTAILPRGKTFDPVYAGWDTLNGNGDMTGTTGSRRPASSRPPS